MPIKGGAGSAKTKGLTPSHRVRSRKGKSLFARTSREDAVVSSVKAS